MGRRLTQIKKDLFLFFLLKPNTQNMRSKFTTENTKYFIVCHPTARFLTTNSTNYTNKLILFFFFNIRAIRVIRCYS